jgi:peptidoglycan/LPS O-acetylase OafA/YrhL
VLRGFLYLDKVGSTSFDSRINAVTYMTYIYWPTWARLDGLLAGVAAAAIQTFRPRLWASLTARPNLVAGVGAVGVIASAALFGGYITWFLPAVFGYPLLAWSLMLIVAAANDSRSMLGRRNVPGAAALATGAYSLYLSHKAVFQATASALRDKPAEIQNLGLGVAILVALAVAAILYWVVERPFLALRDRWNGPSRSPLDAAQAAHIETG